MTNAHSNAHQVMSGLKDFQRATVEHVFRRLYLDGAPTHRFLVADEVGLGKTKIAAGLIAKTIEHLQRKVERIDVVYICSNADIARQNLNSLCIPGIEATEPTRITLMPLVLNRLQTGDKANLVALTPGTSFDVSSGAGRADERALLYYMCQDAWSFDDKLANRNVFRVDSGHDPFIREIERVRAAAEAGGIHVKSMNSFHEALRKEGGAGGKSYRARFGRLADQFGAVREMSRVSDYLKSDARKFVGDLRSLLSRTCLRLLEPDLIILDEFQRFKHLLGEPNTDEIQLAHDLFNYQDETSRARVLLLSATPYKMYTLSGEEAQSGEEHYADFIDTIDFLHQGMIGGNERQAAFKRTLGAFRKSLQQFDLASMPACRDIRINLETQLKQVMVRTERLAKSADRNGMLMECAFPEVDLRLDDVLAFGALQKVRKIADADDALEYWKSAPYLLNFMEKDSYQFKRKVMAVEADVKRKLRAALRDNLELIMPWDAVDAYKRINPPNARMRALVHDVIDVRGLWQLLWMPASLPYTQPAGPYAGLDLVSTTKRLIFSSWQVVPRAIATLLSYEAERKMTCISAPDLHNSPKAREDRRPLLNFRRAEDRLAGMNLMALYYPSSALALLCDPLLHAGARVADVLDRFEEAIAKQLAVSGIMRLAASEGKVDESWYWAAPVLLDLALHSEGTHEWLQQPNLASVWYGEKLDDDSSAWHDHVAELCKAQTPRDLNLGVMPKNLTRVLALVALASPSICMLRAIARATNCFDAKGLTQTLRTYAASAGLALRSLFNQAEAITLVRGLYTDEADPYWLRTLRYSADGNLQSMLDEYVHLLRETAHPVTKKAIGEITTHIRSVLMMRTANNRIDRMDPEDIGAQQPKQVAMRLRFAMRYGIDRLDDDQTVRADIVRKAFNSPFHPFVLASTSVGQEGLDFHRYCHAVVHWNLPSNPVDMEQREGRIHRYKGHAVRKNIAMHYGVSQVTNLSADPWQQLFAAAVTDREKDMSDITPYWIFCQENGSRIERYVPALPLSRDALRYSDLCQSLAAYRIVFGQSRQQELLHLLTSSIKPEQLANVINMLRVNLEPDCNQTPMIDYSR